MHYVDPAPKSLNSVLMMQFYCDTSAPDAATKCPMITPTPGEPAVYTYDYLANLLEASADDYGQNRCTQRRRHAHQGDSDELQLTQDSLTHALVLFRSVVLSLSGQMVGWLILTMAVLRILNLLALKYVSHIKR